MNSIEILKIKRKRQSGEFNKRLGDEILELAKQGLWSRNREEVLARIKHEYGDWRASSSEATYSSNGKLIEKWYAINPAAFSNATGLGSHYRIARELESAAFRSNIPEGIYLGKRQASRLLEVVEIAFDDSGNPFNQQDGKAFKLSEWIDIRGPIEMARLTCLRT
jgi:hypothetical protein